MRYNFDKIIDRKTEHSVKYCELDNKFGCEDIIPLWIADMDFQTAQPVIDALVEKAKHGMFGYTYRPDSYNEAFIQWQQRRNGYTPATDLIEYSPGVVPSISYIVSQMTSEGDAILIQPPVYGEFASAIVSWNRKVVNNPLVRDGELYSIDFMDFEKKIKDNNVKVFILCNPHNPVGRVWRKNELEKMAEICLNNNVLVVSDEIHSDLILREKHIVMASLSKDYEKNTISLFSSAKTFNLAGLQASTIVFNNKENLNRYRKFWAKMAIRRNNAFSIVAVEAAFRHGEDWLTQVIDYIKGNIKYVREYIIKEIPKIKVNDPECSYLLWLDCTELGFSDSDLSRFMLEKAKIGLNSGVDFGPGGEQHMRLNVACPRVILEKAMSNLNKAVASL